MLWASWLAKLRRRACVRRGRQRRAAVVEPLESRVLPTVITVNSLADNTTAGDGLVTLREAIAAANTDGSTDLGETGSGSDQIVFAPDLNDTIALLLGQMEITQSLIGADEQGFKDLTKEDLIALFKLDDQEDE